MAQRIRAARRWKGGSRWEPPLYELTENDQWCNETRLRVGRAIGRYMKQSNLLHRRFDGLTDLEMDGIVEAAVTEWTIARSDRYDMEEAKEQAPSSTHSLDHYGI